MLLTRFDGLRAGSIADRSKLYEDLASGPFFGFNRPGANLSKGMIDSFWMQGMRAGHKSALDCIKAFSETDFTEDLKKFDVPTLIIHGAVEPFRERLFMSPHEPIAARHPVDIDNLVEY